MRPLISLASIAFAGLCAAPAGAESLLESWRAAMRYDPDYLAAVEARTSGSEGNAQALSLLLPQLKVQGGTSTSRSNASIDVPAAFQSFVGGDATGTRSSVDVVLSQPLYDAPAAAQARILRERARAARTGFNADQQTLMAQVADAWLEIWAADDDLRAVRSHKAALQRELQAARARFELGTARVTDVRESEAQFDQAAASEISALARRQVAISRYRELTTLDYATGPGLADGFTPEPPKGGLDTWQAQAETQGSEVVRAGHKLVSAKASVNQYQWTGRPKVTAVATYSGSWFDGGAGQILNPRSLESYALGAQVSVPLITGGYYSSKLREANADVRQAEREMDAARRNARLETQQAWLGLSSGVDRILALRTALKSAQLEGKAAVTGREVGIRTEANVLEAEARVYATVRDLNAANYDYEKNRIRLAKAAGILDESVLREIDADFTSAAQTSLELPAKHD